MMFGCIMISEVAKNCTFIYSMQMKVEQPYALQHKLDNKIWNRNVQVELKSFKST